MSKLIWQFRMLQFVMLVSITSKVNITGGVKLFSMPLQLISRGVRENTVENTRKRGGICDALAF